MEVRGGKDGRDDEGEVRWKSGEEIRERGGRDKGKLCGSKMEVRGGEVIWK